MSVTIELNNVDWKLLVQQKQALLESCDTPNGNDFFAGLVYLIDEIQDQAAIELGESTVFGPACKFCKGQGAWNHTHKGQCVCDSCWDERLRITG